jgi:hypothetical protein
MMDADSNSAAGRIDVEQVPEGGKVITQYGRRQTRLV